MQKPVLCGLLPFFFISQAEEPDLNFNGNRIRFTLSNGVRVLAESRPDASTVSIGVWLHTGSMMESPQEEGLAHFMEHMAFKGTQSRSTLRIAEETDLLGGQLNACTTKDHTCYYNRVISEDLPKALDLIGDLVLYPSLLPEEMIKERSVICEEIAMDEDDPESYIADLLTQYQFADTTMAHPILGKREQINRYTPNDLLRFRASHYLPDRCVIAVCGSFDENVLRSEVDRVFGDWTGKSCLQPVPSLQVRDGQFCTLERDLEQVHILLGYPGYPYGDSHLIPMEILSSIIGASASARLFQRIREELGMAYTVYSYHSPVEGNGTFCLYAAASPDNSADVLREMDHEMKRLASDGVSQEEFEQNRKMLRISFLMGLESSGSRMMSLGQAMTIRGMEYMPENTLKTIEGVTRDEVVELAREICSHKPSLAVIGRHASALEGIL